MIIQNGAALWNQWLPTSERVALCQRNTQNDNSTAEDAQSPTEDAQEVTYIGNANTKKFHYPWCASVNKMAEHNRVYFYGSRDELINRGYVPCKNCNP